jgi:hypothetical protein
MPYYHKVDFALIVSYSGLAGTAESCLPQADRLARLICAAVSLWSVIRTSAAYALYICGYVSLVNKMYMGIYIWICLTCQQNVYRCNLRFKFPWRVNMLYDFGALCLLEHAI